MQELGPTVNNEMMLLNIFKYLDTTVAKTPDSELACTFMLVKKQSRLDVRKYSVSHRTINAWNKISSDCVHASSVNMVKN